MPQDMTRVAARLVRMVERDTGVPLPAHAHACAWSALVDAAERWPKGKAGLLRHAGGIARQDLLTLAADQSRGFQVSTRQT